MGICEKCEFKYRCKWEDYNVCNKINRIVGNVTVFQKPDYPSIHKALNRSVSEYKRNRSDEALNEIKKILEPKINRIWRWLSYHFDLSISQEVIPDQIIDEALERLIKKYRKIGKDSNFLGFFHRYFFFEVRDLFNKHRRKYYKFYNIFQIEIVDDKILKNLLSSLPRRQRKILKLFIRGENSTQIAKRLKLRASTVRNTKRALRRKISKRIDTSPTLIYGEVELLKDLLDFLTLCTLKLPHELSKEVRDIMLSFCKKNNLWKLYNDYLPTNKKS